MPIDRNTAQYITGNPQQPTQSSAPGIWDIDEQGSAQAAGRWPLPPNVVQRSLRFNSADSAYLNRTPATASNRKTWTWSGWVKRSASGELGLFAGYSSGSVRVSVGFEASADSLQVYANAGAINVQTSASYRDFSAWYHVVVAFDTTQATSTDRVKIYVNGTQVTQMAVTTYPSQNTDWAVNNTNSHFINSGTGSQFYTCYMAEINFIDGQALTPSSFGQTDAQTGQWIPRVYSGSYGTNGFRLQFLDNSGTTATTLGKDTSGMGNNWTPNNFSVAAGSGNDSLRDVPMNYYSPDNGLGGEVIGNYATFNPLVASQTGSTLSNGNLDVVTPTTGTGKTNYGEVTATIGVSSGKWYWEVLTVAIGGGKSHVIGVDSDANASGADGLISAGNRYSYASFNGNKYSGATSSAYGATYDVGDTVGVALDMDNGSITFYKNGVSQGVAFTGLSGAYYPAISDTGGGNVTLTANFGQRPFAYTAPSGFKALCTQNLPWSGTITTSGTFTGNASTDGPFVYLNGIPTAMTINGNAVTFGTQADKLSNGFKVRSSSASYNASGSNTYSVSTTGNQFSKANAQANP